MMFLLDLKAALFQIQLIHNKINLGAQFLLEVKPKWMVSLKKKKAVLSFHRFVTVIK